MLSDAEWKQAEAMTSLYAEIRRQHVMEDAQEPFAKICIDLSKSIIQHSPQWFSSIPHKQQIPMLVKAVMALTIKVKK